MPIRCLVMAVLIAVVVFDTTASALAPAEKMETCKIGADQQKLTGAKRKKFLARCMADSDGTGAKGN